MKRALIIIAILLTFALCLGLAFAIDISRAGADVDAPGQSIPTATLSRAPEATATPEPDYAATAQVAQANEQAARDARTEAERAELHAEQTAEAVKLAAAMITQQAEILAVTKQAADYSAKATADAGYLVRVEAERKADVDKRGAEERRLLAEAAANRAEIERQTKWVSLTFQALMVLGICVLCVAALVIVVKRRETISQGEITEAEPEEVAPAPRAFAAGLSVRILLDECGVNYQQLEKLAAGLAAKRPFTHGEWTPAPRGFSEQQFSRLQGYLVSMGRAEWSDETHKGGLKLTPLGVDFFGKIAPGMAQGEKHGNK